MRYRDGREKPRTASQQALPALPALRALASRAALLESLAA